MPRRLSTRLVHGAPRPAGEGSPLWTTYRPTAPAIHPSSSFVYDQAHALHEVFVRDEGYCYTRYANPTLTELERAVAAVESGLEPAVTVAFGSGMAALHGALVAALRALGAGPAVVVASRDLYGATVELLRRYVASPEVRVELVDLSRPADVRATVRGAAAGAARVVILYEVLTNPLLHVLDVDEIQRAATELGALTVVDNTFATPCLLRPLERGADVVVHSATKYLGGHGDAMGGVATVRASRADVARELRLALRFFGHVLGPFEAWTLLRGMRTLELRFERQCRSAADLAARLEGHPRVKAVSYPGLASSSAHDVARRVFEGGFGGMVAFELRGARADDVEAFFDRLEIVVPATTLGDVTSLVLQPARSSHRGLSAEERAALGIADGLVRLSVGVEDVEDLWGDLSRALG